MDGTNLTNDTISIGREGSTTIIGSDTLAVSNIGVGATNTLSLAGNVNVSVGLPTTTFSFNQSILPFDPNYTRYGVYAQGMFVVLEDANNSGRILTSTDGLTSTSYTGVGAVTARGLAYGMINGTGTFLATTYASPSVIWKSTNGTTWTQETPTNTLGLIHGIAYGDGVFVALTQTTTNNVATTTDGKTWTNIQTRGGGSDTIVFGAMSNGTNVFLVSNATLIYRSTDKGVTWNAGIALPTGSWGAPRFGNDVFLLISRSTNAITRSTDGGLNWSSPIVQTGLTLFQPIFVENTWYLGTENGILLISNDNAITWERRNIGLNIDLMLYGDSKLVGYYKQTQTLITIKKKRNDGTNVTADTLTIGQEGTTPVLGAPLTIGYSPSQITNINQIGYNIRVGPAFNTIAIGVANYICVVQIPIGVWLVSSQVYWNGYTASTGSSNSIVKNTTSTGTGGNIIMNFFGGISSSTSFVENNTFGTIYYTLNNYNSSGATQSCFSGSTAYTFLSFTRIG